MNWKAPIVLAVFQALAYAQNPNGVWRTDGYGELLEIVGKTVRMYEITSASCIPAGNATRRAATTPGEFIFVGREGTLRLSPGDGADRLWLKEGGVSRVSLQRIAQLPGICRVKTPNTPESNYDVFWRTFSEQYPFFGLRKVDWSATDRQFRLRVSASTSPAELFGILQHMIEPLSDAHTGIEAKSIHRQFDGYRPQKRPDMSREIISQRYVRGKLRSYCHEMMLGSKPRSLLHFGLISDAVGYLRIDEFPGHCEDELDRIFRQASELKGLIIDERLNTGGSDAFGIALAARLTTHDYLAYSKVARNDVQDNGHRTAAEMVTVHASPRPGFSGEVVLLIGPDSVSAAEVFAMALFGRKPRVIRVGENTQGVFSDVLERRLPNGWRFSLPNEIYLAEDGRAFDGVGVPPDVRVPVFPDEDLTAGRDTALEKAIAFLAQ